MSTLHFDPERNPDVATPSSHIRLKLIAGAMFLVQKASRLPGVTRIALIGSLTTSKPDPKDIDFLVTVTDDANLAPLAVP